jgi:uncharacterized membrane protein
LNALLHDYGGAVVSTAAIIASFIAVVVEQLFKDSRIDKVFLVVATGLLGAVAIGANFYSQYKSLPKPDIKIKYG